MNKCAICTGPTPDHVCRGCFDDAVLGGQVRGQRTARFDLEHSCGEPEALLDAVLLSDGQIVGATYECGHWGMYS